MEKLKEVSKAKHWILARYFPAWAKILGSRYNTLLYVDCFAGEGQYAQGEPGSPMRASFHPEPWTGTSHDRGGTPPRPLTALPWADPRRVSAKRHWDAGQAAKKAEYEGRSHKTRGISPELES